MKPKQLLFIPVTLIVMGQALHAATITGTVLAFDRKANVIVLSDKTVYNLAGQQAEIPEGLEAGDRVQIDGHSEGESGYGTLTSIKILE